MEGICPHCGTPARGDECDQGCGKHLEPGEIKEPVCKVCGTKAEFRDQEHYFFRLSEFKDFLLPFLENLRGTSNAKNYAIGWIKDELHDWCITRTLDWGVKFPGSDDLVVYVWVDAPIGYIAFTEEWAKKTGNDWKRYWCGENRVTHFIGGDIIYHHCIFWPALLKGAGYGVPHAIVASGMVKVDDHKFSKSRGYVVWTNDDYLDKGLPADYLRYYLLAYTSHTKELNFSWKVFSRTDQQRGRQYLRQLRVPHALILPRRSSGEFPRGTSIRRSPRRSKKPLQTSTGLCRSTSLRVLSMRSWRSPRSAIRTSRRMPRGN